MDTKRFSTIVLFTAITSVGADRAYAGNKLFVGGLTWSTHDAVVIDSSVHRRLARDGSEFLIASVVQIYDESGDLVARVFSEPQPIMPIRPLDQACSAIQAQQSTPSGPSSVSQRQTPSDR